MIQAFEYTYELTWNTIKDYFENREDTDIFGSRDAFRLRDTLLPIRDIYFQPDQRSG